MQDFIAQTFQQEAGRVIALLYNYIGDFELVEDAVQDAMVLALERWPVDGTPRNPGGWILTVARNKAIDRLRRDKTLERKKSTLKALIDLEREDMPMDFDAIPDERLKLIFTCCHPALAKEAQVALTLQTLGGLTTPEIATAFLVPLPTMAQRLVRAKRKIRDAGIPYQVPSLDILAARVDSVLSVLYLIFNAGYIAPVGDQLMRLDLCAEATRLARILMALLEKEPTLPDNPEVMGLLALMLLHDSRAQARVDAQGELVPLEAQDRTRWDQAKITEGLALLDRALRMQRPGPYQLQAAISALHAQAKQPQDTDWAQIAVLYELLHRMIPSPVIELNRAVAVAMAAGIEQGMALLDALEQRGELQDYYLLHAARADLLRRTGQWDAARSAYLRALDLCQNHTERAFLTRRLTEIDQQTQG
ncbi:MAG: RNA polymerase sigma factor [Anaerolineae bacterium]|nr:RNA polymerase sigma factor [Anaerolineae bacterium]